LDGPLKLQWSCSGTTELLQGLGTFDSVRFCVLYCFRSSSAHCIKQRFTV